ncbi:MAG: bifunctional aspartate kinase/homoserine dehydrogenase I [Spirochaetaceae bacterium]|jgi:aspartokinase/homoserine dehydrogenase 1|nr:bifunctional aspartate kinase/homoserine dehydrogenase I [Spirochaetaceae bacterium]
MVVLKFGGTSVGSAEAVKQILAIVGDSEHLDRVQVIVVSALSGVTDALIGMAQKATLGDLTYREDLRVLEKRHEEFHGALLSGESGKEASAFVRDSFGELGRFLDGVGVLRELTPRVLDYIMSFGERISAVLISRVLTGAGRPSEYCDARELIITDDNFGNARFFPEESYLRIKNYMAKQTGLVVAAGFIGATGSGETTTLGRGGSDLSAAIFGAALNAEEVEIWTDVDGILTADPRLVKDAFRIDAISYVEAMELSHFGAKVLHPPTVKPALEKGIPIRIRNTFNPRGEGTRISRDGAPGKYPIQGISSMGDIALIRVQGSGMAGVAGFSSRLFGALAAKNISVILITQGSSEYSICFAVRPEDARLSVEAISKNFEREIASALIDPPILELNMAIIAVVGAGMKRSSGVAGKVFHALGRNGINVVAIAQGSSELNISAVIRKEDTAKALNAIHEAFFLAGIRSVNLFLVGTGLIGGTLLKQLERHRIILADKHKIRINLTGLANSRRMLFDSEGISPGGAKTLLMDEARQAEPFELSGFIKRMKSYNLPNTAFCDCTASDTVARTYGELLASSIPVVTPNKRANSGAYEYYSGLTGLSREKGIPYLYETTVCAGLPVISTLRDLHLSGDTVRRIEAVLSGTLSYIFNNFDGTKTFSALVREARARGYTEPDPRDDLNAMDAARKALVLARECGMPLEFEQVSIEPILPEACFRAQDVDAFFGELEKSDGAFEERRKQAEASGRALRYVALIEAGRAELALRPEAPDSPFRSLVDADNMVVITTDRYSSLPLVVKGPGAGAEVTAGGVFADIVRIARTLV